MKWWRKLYLKWCPKATMSSCQFLLLLLLACTQKWLDATFTIKDVILHIDGSQSWWRKQTKLGVFISLFHVTLLQPSWALSSCLALPLFSPLYPCWSERMWEIQELMWSLSKAHYLPPLAGNSRPTNSYGQRSPTGRGLVLLLKCSQNLQCGCSHPP